MERNQDDAGAPEHGDELDDAVIAADDTGMLSGERLITVAEIEEADAPTGNV